MGDLILYPLALRAVSYTSAEWVCSATKHPGWSVMCGKGLPGGKEAENQALKQQQHGSQPHRKRSSLQNGHLETLPSKVGVNSTWRRHTHARFDPGNGLKTEAELL